MIKGRPRLAVEYFSYPKRLKFRFSQKQNMSDYPTPSTPFVVKGLREVCEVNGRNFIRKRGAQQWHEYEPDRDTKPPETPLLYLSLVHEQQGDGEPFHWSLFVARENEPGIVYQVKGDAECMAYQPMSSTNITNSESFFNIYNLATVDEYQAVVVKQVAESEPPPKAENRASVTENCQGWAVRVITKLVERGIVPAAKVRMAQSMMEPV